MKRTQIPRLRDFERQRDRSLLPLGGERRRLQPVQLQLKIVPVRPAHRLPETFLPPPRRRQRRRKIPITPRFVGHPKRVAPTADSQTCPRQIRIQLGHQPLTRLQQDLATLDKHRRERIHLTPRPPLLQQRISRPQRPLVVPKNPPVARHRLHPQKIEIPPPRRPGPIHQLKVGIREPRHPSRRQIVVWPRLRLGVEQQAPPPLRVPALQMHISIPPPERKPAHTAPRHLRRLARPRRLQPQQHTHRLEDRRLPLRIPPHHIRAPFPGRKLQGFETTEPAQPHLVQHTGDSACPPPTVKHTLTPRSPSD